MGINIDVGAARYSNLDIIATQQDCAIFLGEEDEGTAIYCDLAVGRVCSGICGDGIVDGLAGIGGGIYEVVTMETDGVFGDLHHRAFPCDIGSEGR